METPPASSTAMAVYPNSLPLGSPMFFTTSKLPSGAVVPSGIVITTGLPLMRALTVTAGSTPPSVVRVKPPAISPASITAPCRSAGT